MTAQLDQFLAALGRNSFAAGVLIILVLFVQQIFKSRLSPHWRCMLWLLVVLRLLPVSFSSPTSIFNLMPRWAVGDRASAPESSSSETAASKPSAMLMIPVSGADSTALANDSTAPVEDVPLSAVDAAGSAPPSWHRLIFFAWLTGVIALGGYVSGRSISLRRSLARTQPVRDPEVVELLRDCAKRMGVGRLPILAESTAVRSPVLHGFLRPRLLLPAGFTQTFSTAELHFVLLHELAHVRRGDLLLNWLMTALQIVHWFNPLVWLGFARWRVDREIACDAAAMEAAGAGSNRAYGETMLRLLQHFALPGRNPALVGILEDKRQLERRIRMIVSFAPTRRPFAAAGLLAILGLVGLTDAQVAPALAPIAASTDPTAPSPDTVPLPQPSGPYVLFVVNGAESMLGDMDSVSRSNENESADYRERGRTYTPEDFVTTDALKRAAPKWQRAAETLKSLLTALEPGTAYQVVIGRDSGALKLGAGLRDGSDADALVIDGITRRLRNQMPAGRFNLEIAFGTLSAFANSSKPERIVLITDGLPTSGGSVAGDGNVTEAQRIRLFQDATKTLPPRIPVQTVLLPAPAGDPGAAGLYWELANATRGRLTIPAKPGIEARTHLALVIDTSGSMRDPNNGGLWPIVIETLEALLDANPQLTGVQLLDGDGRFVLGRRGTGAGAWLANTPATRESIKDVLRRYAQDTVSNPVPGIHNALRFLYDKDAPDMRMGVTIFGDEFNSKDRAGAALDQIDARNPRDANGRRRITIDAIGFPTTIRYQFSMGNTGLRFANLMRLLTQEHDGSFVALPDL